MTNNPYQWERIERIELSSDGVIDFQDIPDTYDHLRVMYLAKESTAGNVSEDLSIRFNNDASGAYRASLNYLRTDGLTNSGNDGFTRSGLDEIPIGSIPSLGAGPHWGMGMIAIPYYRVDGFLKSAHSLMNASLPNISTVAENTTSIGCGQWDQSSTDITRVQLGEYVGGTGALNDLESGSEASLWGLRDP